MRWLWRRKPKENDFVCEICGGHLVIREGVWDYCLQGHIYIGKRSGL